MGQCKKNATYAYVGYLYYQKIWIYFKIRDSWKISGTNLEKQWCTTKGKFKKWYNHRRDLIHYTFALASATGTQTTSPDLLGHLLPLTTRCDVRLKVYGTTEKQKREKAGHLEVGTNWRLQPKTWQCAIMGLLLLYQIR